MDEIENWKPVEGTRGLYEISNLGRIRSNNYRKKGISQIIKGTKNKK